MGACSSTEATIPPQSNMHPAPAVVVGATSAPAPCVYSPDPSAGFWTPEKEDAKRRVKLLEIQRRNEAEIQQATGHLQGHGRQKSHSASAAGHVRRQSSISTTVRLSESVAPSASEPPSFKVTDSPSITSPVAVSDIDLLPKSQRGRYRAPSHASASAGSTGSAEVSTIDSQSDTRTRGATASQSKQPRKEWDYDSAPGARGGEYRRSQSNSSLNHRQSLSSNTPSTPNANHRRSSTILSIDSGEGKLGTVDEPSRGESSMQECSQTLASTPTAAAAATAARPFSDTQRVNTVSMARSAPVSPRASTQTPTASEASAIFGVKLRRAPVPATVIASVA